MKGVEKENYGKGVVLGIKQVIGENN